MHPTIVAELAAAHHAELLRAAEQHRRAGPARAARLAHPPAHRPARGMLAAAVAGSAQRLRMRASQLQPLDAPPPSKEPCCA